MENSKSIIYALGPVSMVILEGRKIRKIIDRFGVPWFCALDTVRALYPGWSLKDILPHRCNGDGIKTAYFTENGELSLLTVIDEFNLYKLIPQSMIPGESRLLNWLYRKEQEAPEEWNFERTNSIYRPFLFNFEGYGIRKVVDKKGTPWFVAKDVGRILGYENPKDMVAKLCSYEETRKAEIITRHGTKWLIIINKKNLLRVILDSETPIAKRFKEWVCDKFLNNEIIDEEDFPKCEVIDTSNSQITLFNFQGVDIREITDEKGNPWFIAKDVAKVLGYKNVSAAIGKHCREAGITKCDIRSGSQNREILIINEPNLYRLVGRSRMPEAQKFEEWIYEGVLPTIRKTGRYDLKEKTFRKDSKEIRSGFSRTLREVGLIYPPDYVEITKQMKKNLGISESKKKDEMTDLELMMISAGETLATTLLMRERPHRYDKIIDSCCRAARVVWNTISGEDKIA